MHYILHLSLEGFYIRHGAKERTGPTAIVRDGIVLDANSEARARGMSVGMEKRTARAIVHEAEFLPWQEDLYDEAQKEWLDSCTEFTGIIEPDLQHSVYLDLSGHPNPIDVSERIVRALVSATGLKVRYGAAPSKWLAKLAERSGDCGAAIRNPREFLSALPVSKLTPVSLEHRERLSFLGYRTIGQILNIPHEVVRQQFGPEGMMILRAARGEVSDPVTALYPPDSLIESLIFEGAIDNLETIDLALKDLAGRVAQRLSAKSMQGQELSVSIELESGAILNEKRRFSKPIYNYPGALASLRLLTEHVLNTEQSCHKCEVVAIRIQLTNLKHNREKQKELLGHGRTNDKSAFQHIRTVFGDAAVQLGGEIPVPRRVKVLREWKNAIGWS